MGCVDASTCKLKVHRVYAWLGPLMMSALICHPISNITRLPCAVDAAFSRETEASWRNLVHLVEKSQTLMPRADFSGLVFSKRQLLIELSQLYHNPISVNVALLGPVLWFSVELNAGRCLTKHTEILKIIFWGWHILKIFTSSDYVWLYTQKCCLHVVTLYYICCSQHRSGIPNLRRRTDLFATL